MRFPMVPGETSPSGLVSEYLEAGVGIEPA
jgi:hypothetical protein